MAYSVDRYSSNSFNTGWPLTIPDNTINTTITSLKLLGRGVANYGEIVAEDLVHLTENFAGTTSPSNPITGQTWFLANPATPGAGQLKAYNGTSWKTVGGTPAGTIATRPSPANSVAGDVYYATDTLEKKLYVFDGSNWIQLTGASSSNTAPLNPIIGQLWYDTTTTPASLKIWNGSGWVPVVIGGVGTEGVSVTSSTTTPVGAKEGDLWYNTTTDILYVYDGSLFVPVSGGSGGDVINVGPDAITVLNIDGQVLGIWSKSVIASGALPTSYGTPPQNLQTLFPTGLNVGLNLSNVANNKFRGTSTSADYADIAERYFADKKYDFGTVVKIGGVNEITETTTEYDTNVFGVISKNPGYEMNAAAGPDETHPFVALAGRLQVKIIGTISKGDRLVSSNIPGVAQKGIDATVGTVIGRALENKTTDDLGYVEIVVGTK